MSTGPTRQHGEPEPPGTLSQVWQLGREAPRFPAGAGLCMLRHGGDPRPPAARPSPEQPLKKQKPENVG